MLDTLAVYPYDKTIGKLTFKFDPKNAVSDVTMEGFRGEGKSEMGMSNSYYDGNFPEEYRQPIFMNDNPAKKYRVKFRLKGEFRYYTEHWYTDYIYMMLSASFLPYPPAVSEDVFLCKSNEAFAELNTPNKYARAHSRDFSAVRSLAIFYWPQTSSAISLTSASLFH